MTEDSSATKVYRLFRGLGLRHLLVLNVERNIAGIIARYDLMPDSMRRRLAEIRAGQRASRAHFTLEAAKSDGVSSVWCVCVCVCVCTSCV